MIDYGSLLHNKAINDKSTTEKGVGLCSCIHLHAIFHMYVVRKEEGVGDFKPSVI